MSSHSIALAALAVAIWIAWTTWPPTGPPPLPFNESSMNVPPWVEVAPIGYSICK